VGGKTTDCNSSDSTSFYEDYLYYASVQLHCSIYSSKYMKYTTFGFCLTGKFFWRLLQVRPGPPKDYWCKSFYRYWKPEAKFKVQKQT